MGVFIRWNGTVEWNGGMERWNGIVEWNGGIVEGPRPQIAFCHDPTERLEKCGSRLA